MNAQVALSSISENRALWLSQYHTEVRERDRISNIAGAEERGFEKGRAEGRAEGIIEGRNNLIESLRAFSKLGLSLEQILDQLKENT